MNVTLRMLDVIEEPQNRSRDHSTLSINLINVAVCPSKLDRSSLQERPCQLLQMIAILDIVLVEHRDEIAIGLGNTKIAR